MRNRYVLFGLHIVGWLAFLLLPYLFAIRGAIDLSHFLENRHDMQSLITNVLLIIFSYVNYYVFVPRFYLAKKRALYFGCIIGCFIVIALVPRWSEPLVQSLPMPPKPFLNVHQATDVAPADIPDNRQLKPRSLEPPPFYHDLSQVILVFVISVLVSISVQVSDRLKKLEIDKLQAELGQLKAQIHPHFLFNTLNSIYALAIRKDDKTADTIVKLAEFMRYMTREASQNWVPLAKELTYIQNYLDLQNTRLRNSVHVSYTVEGTVAGKQVAPLILFTFIENAFKHGVNPDENSQIRINLQIRDADLLLSVYNRKVTVSDSEIDGGVGLYNTQARLALLYPKQHQLTINNTDDDYTITLILNQI